MIPSAVSASASLAPWRSYTFGAKNVIDGDVTTCWQAAMPHAGRTVRIEYPRTPIKRIGIANGMQLTDEMGDLFLMNARMANATLRFSDGSSFTMPFEASARGFQTLDVPSIASEWVEITVGDTHPGTRWTDVAVSEVALWADGPSSAGVVSPTSGVGTSASDQGGATGAGPSL